MSKTIAGLSLGIILLLVAGGLYKSVFGSAVVVTTSGDLRVGNKAEWKSLLGEVGWGKTEKCRKLSGESLDCNNLKRLEITYTGEPQLYLLQQTDASSSAFAAVGEKYDKDKLALLVYVAPEKLAKGDKGWWIGHQVIWALNTIFNPDLSAEKIIENNFGMFGRYQDSGLILWW